jgi:hypothetical protein
MEVYKFNNLENGDILLEKIILDNMNYTIINQDNGDKILKKIASINIIDINDIRKYDFTDSKILYCLLNDNEVIKLKYKSILNNIYKIINCGTQIIKNSKLNIKTIDKQGKCGFYYLKDLGISIQGVDCNKCLLEIINQCIENKITLTMKIKLNDEINITINF